jgi:hypothetical protein
MADIHHLPQGKDDALLDAKRFLPLPAIAAALVPSPLSGWQRMGVAMREGRKLRVLERASLSPLRADEGELREKQAIRGCSEDRPQ